MPRVAAAAQEGSSRVPRTVEAYLTATNLDALEAEGELLPHEARALEALRAAAAAAARPVQSGTALYQQLAASELLSTVRQVEGCGAIDDHLLRGGLRPGQLVEFCGESASGKTQLCLTAAASAARQAKRVVYIDTSNALRGKRLQQVVEALPPLMLQPGQPTAADPLKFIEVRRCYDIHSLLHALDELLAHQAQQAQQAQHAQQDGGEVGLTVQQQEGMQQQQQHVQQQEGVQQQQQQQAAPASAGATAAGGPRRRLEDLPVHLLIVDSLSALITPVLGGGAGQHSQGHALLAAAATNLKAFAAGPGLPVVLVTNHMVGGSDDRRHEKRPAMGESWRNQPHSRIQLCKGPPGGSVGQQCTAVLRASALLPAGLSVPFTLSTAGVAAEPEAAGGRPQPMQL